MGVVVGLLLGTGVLLVWQSVSAPQPVPREGGQRRRPVADLLGRAGLGSVAPATLVTACAGAALLAALTTAVLSRSVVVSAAFAVLAAWLPVALVRGRARRRQVELRALWPDAVDNLTSAVRAGLSLPEALTQLGVRGPDELRRAFVAFGEDYRANGRFGDALDRLKAALADPVGDRVCEALRVARDVGGSDLGRLLRTLSAFLREDARTRAELETRQGWTVSAARLAVAAPWLVLGLLSLRPDAVAAYDSTAGFAVLVGGGAVCLLAYRLMLRIGRLPDEERVLR